MLYLHPKPENSSFRACCQVSVGGRMRGIRIQGLQPSIGILAGPTFGDTISELRGPGWSLYGYPDWPWTRLEMATLNSDEAARSTTLWTLTPVIQRPLESYSSSPTSRAHVFFYPSPSPTGQRFLSRIHLTKVGRSPATISFVAQLLHPIYCRGLRNHQCNDAIFLTIEL